MQTGGLLDFLPLWCIFLATAAVVLLAIEGGFHLGNYRRQRTEGEDKPPVGEAVAATLALLAFILAFTFGLAGSWFDVRRRLVIDEAKAIGTTYLRAGMLPEPHRSDVRGLLREYVDVRLEAMMPGKLAQSIERSEQLHARLWAHATALGEEHPNSVVVGLFIWSLNEVIDLHTERLAIGPRTRLPGTMTTHAMPTSGSRPKGDTDAELPTQQTIKAKLNLLGFRLTRVAKCRPQKGSSRPMPSSIG